MLFEYNNFCHKYQRIREADDARSNFTERIVALQMSGKMSENERTTRSQRVLDFGDQVIENLWHLPKRAEET